MSASPDLPLISIVVPTYNRAHLLKHSLDSALCQTYPHLEIVVSDNGSTDDTRKVLDHCEDPRVKKLRQTVHVGIIENFQACLAAATGQFVLVLSDDDLLTPQCIELLVTAILDNPSAVKAYGRARKETLDGELFVITRPSPVKLETGIDYVRNWFTGKRETVFCCTLLKTSILKEIGGFPPLISGDAAARAAVALRGDVVHVPLVLATYRVHTASETSSLPLERWLQENQRMVEYICRHVPAELRESVLRDGRRYTVQSSGACLGHALEHGLAIRTAWSFVQQCAEHFGWRALAGWSWGLILAKAAFPAGAIRLLRTVRNQTMRSL
jgi:hypothetical protein